VFNVDQFDRDTLPEARLIGQRERREPGAAVANITPLMNRLQLAGGLHYGGPQPYYMPGPDLIACPTTFSDDHQWAATLLHEGVHATGHPKRLDRPSLKERTKEKYAFEELVAELGAAFLCAHYDITGECQHPAYIASWIEALENDHRMIWRAASEAQHAVQWWLSQYEAEDIPQAAE
jgi:antirestriction protein ArdC